VKKIIQVDASVVTGKATCEVCGVNVATEKVHGDKMCGGCAAHVRAQNY